MQLKYKIMDKFNHRIILVLCSVFLLASNSYAEMAPDQPTVLITGSNRGLGLEFARIYAEQGWNVIATCRNPSAATELNSLGEKFDHLQIETLDVTREEQVEKLAQAYADQPIDVLLNNAAIYGDLQKQTFGTFDYAELEAVFDVNTIGVLRVSEQFLDNVLASEQKKIINLGGGMATQTIGSMFAGHYFIKMSKAASMMSLGIMQRENMESGLIVTMISPGRPDTQLRRDSGWTGETTPVAESAALVVERIALLDDSTKGKVVNHDGKIVPW